MFVAIFSIYRIWVESTLNMIQGYLYTLFGDNGYQKNWVHWWFLSKLASQTVTSLFLRQVRTWSRQYLASKTEEIPAMERLMAWLPGNIPLQVR